MTQSCITCPNFLKADQTSAKLGKDIGAASCKRFGYILSSPGTPTPPTELVEKYAENCGSYGKSWVPSRYDTHDEKPNSVVALPDPLLVDGHERHLASGSMRMAVDSCMSCVNFKTADKVIEQHKWPTPMCGIKGKLIPSTRLTQEATGCEFSRFGQVNSGRDEIQLIPLYANAFDPAYRATRAYREASESSVIDPQEYVTDKEVTEDDEAAGIRAWRKVSDPDGGKGVIFLPIFRTDFFTPDEQAKIPKAGDDEHPELYVDHYGGVYFVGVAWTELDETPALFGEPGTGKTELYRHMAYLMGLPFERMSITASTELDDLAGKMMFTPEEGTYFQYGRFSKGWLKPCVLCIDEPNTGPLDVWQFLRPTFDNSKQLVLDSNKGEALPRHDDCYPGLAMNPAWDMRNIGALPVADADANRLFHLNVELPPASLEREIIAARVALDGWELDKQTLDSLMAVATDLRAMSTEGTLGVSWAIRPQIKVARALRWFTPQMAYRRAIGDFLDPDERTSLLDVVKAHF